LKSIDLNEIDLKLALRIMMSEAEVGTFKDLSKKIEMKETTFRSALGNDSLRLKDFQRIVDVLGYTMTLQKK
jgi:hypothetical protein